MSGDTSSLAQRITQAVTDAAQIGTGAAIATAIHAVRPDDLAEFFHASLAADVDAEPITTGLPASPGAASGRIALTADEAMQRGDAGEDVILVRPETTPDDVLGMQASRGILTARGGLASHAAVVARGWGIPAVVGAHELSIDGHTVTIGSTVLHSGDQVTIDGSTGNVYLGALGTTGAEAPAELDTLLRWADVISRGHVQVRANADTESDASQGRLLGAQGIGLCRTEHMFLAHDRLPLMRRFILADDADTETAALDALEAAQIADFESVLQAMDGLPVTVRLLDPPLHEFLPNLLDLTAREARRELSDSEATELAAVRRLHEANPMIGTRGVRLGVVRPGVYEMQVRALCQAAANLFARGKRPHVEIMIPLVVEAEELRIARGWVRDVLDEIGHPELRSSVITVGAMIETPRAALTAGELAKHADFFSFGTNDLTQMTYAFSRDDVEARLLPAYQALGILPANPFAVLDQHGVGELVRIACEAARASKPQIKLGACGEHAGHPDSAAFLVRLGLDSVSCSPFRVPLARLGVAQALLASGRVKISDIEFEIEDHRATAGGDAGATADESAPSGAAAGDSGDTGEDREDREDGAAGDGVDEWLVLHTLRVRGFVTSEGFRESIGEHPAEILAELVAAGHVRYLEKRDMYGLLPSGKERQEVLLDSYAPPALHAALHAHYERFLELNEHFKQLCTDWQMRGDAQNDHSDAAYDSGCIERLNALNADARPTLAGFTDALPRMGRYVARLDEAAAKVNAGEIKLFTGVMCSSFHDVWMELHEDLIVLQRINRVEEGSF